MKYFTKFGIGCLFVLFVGAGMHFLKTAIQSNQEERKLKVNGSLSIRTDDGYKNDGSAHFNFIESTVVSRSGGGTSLFVYEYLGDTIMVNSSGGILNLSK